MIYNPPGENYKKYVALITQDGTNAPTAIVLENTLGFTPTFTRVYAGVYQILSSGGWVKNKTFVLLGKSDANAVVGMVPLAIHVHLVSENEISLQTNIEGTDTFTDSQNIDSFGLTNTALEIRVYN